MCTDNIVSHIVLFNRMEAIDVIIDFLTQPSWRVMIWQNALRSAPGRVRVCVVITFRSVSYISICHFECKSKCIGVYVHIKKCPRTVAPLAEENGSCFSFTISVLSRIEKDDG